MRVCIALSVFSVGVELPKKYLWRHWKSITMLLGPVMLWGWLVSGLLIWALVPGLDYLAALVIAACVSPTDPILAQAVVGGPWAEKHVPTHIRHMLQCESGCNDGAAFPFLYLAYYLTVNRGKVGFPIAEWVYHTWLYEIVVGTLIGALIGFLARKLIRFSERNKLVDRESFVAQYVSLSVASMGLTVLLGSDDLLAAFACGTAFAWDGWFQKQTADSNFSNIVDLLFNVATFVYIGAEMPWSSFVNGEYNLSVGRLIGLSILVLLLKRLPVVIMLWRWIPDIKTFQEAVFSGYFGPMGVGAIFMCTFGRLMLPEEVSVPPQTPNEVLALTIQPVVYFFVLASVIVHGFTIPFFAFGRKAHININRTLSMHATALQNNEPTWLNRMRHLATSGDETETKEQEPGQISVVEAMRMGLEKQKQQGIAIGEEEKAESSEGTTSSHHHRHSLQHFRTIRSISDIEDGNYAAEDDWDGEDTVEMRRYKERRQERKTPAAVAAAVEQDITEAQRTEEPESMEPDEEDVYPKIREWVEGHKIVVEITDKPLDEARTIVIPIHPDDYDYFKDAKSPLYELLSKYEAKLEHAIGWDKDTNLSELSKLQLYENKVVSKVSHFAKKLASERSAVKENDTEEDEADAPEVVIVRPDGTIIDN